MILYEVKNYETGETIAYFKNIHKAEQYCKYCSNPYINYEKIQVLYDAIDKFKEEEIIGE